MSDWIMPIATIVLILVIPYVVNVCKNVDWSPNTKRWIAIVFSLIGGFATAVLSGLPTPESFVTWVLAVVGGVQIAYSAFKSIGITSEWLDSLEDVGSDEF